MELQSWDAVGPRSQMRLNLKPRFLVCCFFLGSLCFFPTAHCVGANLQGTAAGFYLAAHDDAFQEGLIALKENRLDAALGELTTAEREHPEDSRVRNFRGIVLARLGRTAEAAAEYREAIRIDPRLEDAYRNLGFLEWAENRLGSAREELERAIELSPDDSYAHYYLGRVQLDAQLYTQAFQELERSGVPWPQDAAFLTEAATGYVALGRQEEARRTLHDLAAMPLSDAQSVHVASLLLAVHENETAVMLLQKLSNRKAAAPVPWAQFDLALAYLLTGSYQKAIDQAHAYIEGLRPGSERAESAPAWSLIGIAHSRLGQGEQKAVDAFRQAAKLAPVQEEHWLNLTRELMELGHYADAISAAQAGLSSNPKSYALRLRLGAANLSADRYADAETVFRDLVAAGDPQPISYIGLTQVLLRTGRAQEAASELVSAEQKLGPNFLISYFLGLALDRAGRPQDAVPAFQAALRLNPSSAEAHLGLGKTELTLNRASDAIAELEETLRIDPGNVQARRLLSRAYRRKGDATSASKYAEKAREASSAAEGNLLGDFLLPEWQEPPAEPSSNRVE
jgi:tetratricopeptide (TPR) repeat protein